ncbi:MAG: hypothetical protein JRI68_16065 [Deltaproteobacteria bacterium]|nr:hypothetical protein [Deltaproteobacteria bacterium]
MRRALVCCCAAAIFAAAAAIGTESSAQPSKQERNAARALAISGRKLYKAGDYGTAIERFHSAEEIFHAPAHVLYLARSHAKLGRLVAARMLYQQIVDERLGGDVPPAFHQAQAKARRELGALASRVPAVELTILGPAPDQVSVTIDDRPVPPEALGSPQPLDPGDHRITVRAPGWTEAQRLVSLTEGETKPLRIELRAGVGGSSPSPTGDADHPLGESLPVGPIVLLGFGGAALIVGGVTGALALDREEELHDRCPTNPCPPENEALEDDATVFATVSTVGFVVGGAAVAGGLAWLLFGSSDSDDELSRLRLQPVLGPTSWGIGGTF